MVRDAFIWHSLEQEQVWWWHEIFLTWLVPFYYLGNWAITNLCSIWCYSFGTAEALASQVTQENFDSGLIYPPFTNIRKISAHIAANVAAKAYELGELFLLFLSPPTFFPNFVCLSLLFLLVCPTGLATHLPQPRDLVKYAESCMYSPTYRSYRWINEDGCSSDLIWHLVWWCAFVPDVGWLFMTRIIFWKWVMGQMQWIVCL